MNPLSLLSFFAFLVCLYFGLHTIRKEPGAILNRVFFVYCLTGQIWSFGYVFVYSATVPADIWFWYRFSSFGWCFIHSTLLLFILILTGKKKPLFKWWIYILIYTPSIVLLYRSLTGILIAKEFYPTPWGNAEILASDTLWFNLYAVYNITYLILGCVILWRWAGASEYTRHKKQAKIIIISTLSCFIAASFCNMVIPAMKIKFPAIGAIFALGIIFGAWWAMSRYKLLVITPEIAAGEIISKMMDIMILSDAQDNIISVNRQTEDLLGYSSNELKKKSLLDLIYESEAFIEKLKPVKNAKNTNFQFDGNLITHKETHIPVKIFCSDIKDMAGEVVGIVAVAHDQRDTINLESTLKELQKTNQTLILTRDALWGEMQIAKKIQTVLLPLKPKIHGYQISAYLKPADEVGGDYYDVLNIDGRDWLIIGDVSGHGVPAGLVMMMVQTAIHVTIINFPDIAPSELLYKINTAITGNINKMGENKYMTITVFAIHQGGELTFSGLHQDLLIYRNATDTIDVIETNGTWIGITDNIRGIMKDDFIKMEIGDILLLFTDGITESCEKRTKNGICMFGDDKLIETFHKSCKKQVKEISDSIIDALVNYECTDDITIVILRRDQ